MEVSVLIIDFVFFRFHFQRKIFDFDIIIDLDFIGNKNRFQVILIPIRVVLRVLKYTNEKIKSQFDVLVKI